ncbi:hypothetical protein HZ326_0746 [Fusarium oxysporum f. sp. albedinis]|nr:hypothetical protein HZ326_0746 [Fusarium oxysporum f. sp. albedinis]
MEYTTLTSYCLSRDPAINTRSMHLSMGASCLTVQLIDKVSTKKRGVLADFFKGFQKNALMAKSRQVNLISDLCTNLG